MKDQQVDDLYEFISTELGVSPERLNEDVELFSDLGLDGDDAVILVEKFSSFFKVDVSNFKFNDYFGDESIGLIFLQFFKRRGKRKRLTLKRLRNSIQTGYLD